MYVIKKNKKNANFERFEQQLITAKKRQAILQRRECSNNECPGEIIFHDITKIIKNQKKTKIVIVFDVSVCSTLLFRYN